MQLFTGVRELELSSVQCTCCEQAVGLTQFIRIKCKFDDLAHVSSVNILHYFQKKPREVLDFWLTVYNGTAMNYTHAASKKN